MEALDAGVDDYLVKPFSIEELLARLRALQRRSNALQPQASEPDVLRISDLELNQANHDAPGHRSIQLSNKEYQLLVFLMRRPTRCSRAWRSCTAFGAKATAMTTCSMFIFAI